jgi:flagellar basal body P-ring formation protein FlgA
MIATLILLSLGVRIELPTETRVRGAELSVGSVAHVSGDDPLEVERVRAVRLGYAPAPGHSRLLNALRIAQDVQSQAAGIDLVFAGAAACRVWPQVQTLSGKAIEAVAHAELSRRLADRDATFELVQAVLDLEVPVGETAPDMQARLAAMDVTPGQVNVPVQIAVDGGVWRNVITTWRVQEWQVCPVLVAPAAAGETIRAEMIERRRVPVEAGDALDEARLIGGRLTRAIEAGRALRSPDVLREVLVQPGAAVFLEIRHGAVSAKVPASAEEAGSRGDRIRVRLEGSGRTLQATVLGRDLVRIDMGAGS